MSELKLIVNGVEYKGWVSASVTKSLEAIAGSYSLEISQFKKGDVLNPSWSAFSKQPPIRTEDECTVQLDDDIVVTGSVDRTRYFVDANGHTISIEGRDRAAVLVDCTPPVTQTQFVNLGVLEFCEKLGDPFGITFTLQDGLSDKAVSTTPPAGGKEKATAKRPSAVGSAGKSTTATKIGIPKATFNVERGETAFAMIDQACRLVGVLPVSDGLGNVVLTRASDSECTTSLIEGQNVLGAEITIDGTKRYSRYIVVGQNKTQPEDDSHGYDALAFADIKSTPDHGKDEGVSRTERVLIVPAEGAVTQSFANMRADWEAKVRAARAIQVEVTVQGWRQRDGSLWPLNALVPVSVPSINVSDTLLITAVTYSQSVQDGTRTRLTLTRRDAFVPEPTVDGLKTLSPWWGVAGGNG